MKKNRIFNSIYLLIFSIIIFSGCTNTSAEIDYEKLDLEDQVNDLEEKVSELEYQIEEYEYCIDQLDYAVAEAINNMDNGSLQESYNNLYSVPDNCRYR